MRVDEGGGEGRGDRERLKEMQQEGKEKQLQD